MTTEPSEHKNVPTQDCPHWCCGQHVGQFHPDDAIHTSCIPPQPVILRTRSEPPPQWDQIDLWSQDDPFIHHETNEFTTNTSCEKKMRKRDDFFNTSYQSTSQTAFVDQATYFDVVRMQWVEGGDEWLFVGNGSCSWLITLESARRIFRVMSRILTP